MRFTLAALVFLFIGRKIGWILSKKVLYTSGKGLTVVACILWGISVAFCIRCLINAEHPHWILKMIFGFALGAYVAQPNFGLLHGETIPENAMPRHDLVSMLPLWVFIVASAGLAFLPSN